MFSSQVLIAVEKQRVVEKEAETEKRKIVTEAETAAQVRVRGKGEKGRARGSAGGRWRLAQLPTKDTSGLGLYRGFQVVNQF